MKIFAQFVSSLVGGILLGIVGLAIGATIGGNFGFPEFGGYTAGYEACGVFFAIIGISTGSLLGIKAAKKRQMESRKNLTASIAVLVILVIIGEMIADYNMPPAIGLTILLVPPAVLTLITNWQEFSRTKSS